MANRSKWQLGNINPQFAAACARAETEQNEITRLHGLTDIWLANEILKLARQARACSSYPYNEDVRELAPVSAWHLTYEARLVWGVIPELARRIGVVKLATNEIDWEIRELSDYELRLRVGYCIQNVGPSLNPGWKMITRELVNGNPIAMAADRLLPGRVGDRDDPITRNISEVARNRGVAYRGVWQPSLMDY